MRKVVDFPKQHLGEAPWVGAIRSPTTRSAIRNQTSVSRPAAFHCYGYRQVNPLTGRWVSRDPIDEAGGLNLYGFVGNDGVGQWDYLGTKIEKPNFIRQVSEVLMEVTAGINSEKLQGPETCNSSHTGEIRGNILVRLKRAGGNWMRAGEATMANIGKLHPALKWFHNLPELAVEGAITANVRGHRVYDYEIYLAYECCKCNISEDGDLWYEWAPHEDILYGFGGKQVDLFSGINVDSLIRDIQTDIKKVDRAIAIAKRSCASVQPKINSGKAYP
jgi:RHS repeat-associated protein